MSKIHYFQRYSNTENTVTNNTLQLFARIYDYSTEHASRLLTDITGEPIEIGIEINQQRHAPQSVPDGTVIQRSFKLVIEAKVEASINVDQLARHSKDFTNESQKILLLLTKQKIAESQRDEIERDISKLQPGLIFKNVTYEEICTLVGGMFKEYEFEMGALVEDYVEYCNDLKLFDQSKYLLRISPCGKSITINNKYGIYFHPSDRGYTRHSYVGIYANKKVQSIWAIDSVFDVTYDGKELKKVLVQGRETDDYDKKLVGIINDARTVCGYQIETGHRFFCGKTQVPTDFRKASPGGIQGARFVNLKNRIGDFLDAEDAAKKLNGKEWE